MKAYTIYTQANRFVFITFLLIAVSSNLALAQGVVFTDRSAFNAAIGSTINFDFENLSPTSTTTNRIAVPPFLNFITGNQLSVAPGKFVGTFDSPIAMTISGPTTRNAFGADFSGGLIGANFTGTLTFSLADGSAESFQFQGPTSGWTFFGVVLSKNISSVVFDDGGQPTSPRHQERIDNITYGIAAVPEPTTASLVLFSGICLLGALRARKPTAHSVVR